MRILSVDYKDLNQDPLLTKILNDPQQPSKILLKDPVMIFENTGGYMQRSLQDERPFKDHRKILIFNDL